MESFNQPSTGVLAEVEDVFLDVVPPRVLVRTKANERLIVHFHHEQREEPITFQSRDLKKGGSSLALMYPERRSSWIGLKAFVIRTLTRPL